jgi:chemotaxis protein MotA
VFQDNTQSPVEIRDLIIDLSEQARRQGVLSLEGRVAEMPTDLLRHGLQRVVDGAMPDMVRQQLEVELDLFDEKTSKSKAVFDAMAAYSPAFGMIGTIVGLINMLLTMKDPSTLGASMGLALVTTFYGAVMANLVFLPIAGKLRARSDEQLLLGQMVIQGLVSIASGENPSAVRDMMAVFTGVVGVTGTTLDDADYIKAGAV